MRCDEAGGGEGKKPKSIDFRLRNENRFCFAFGFVFKKKIVCYLIFVRRIYCLIKYHPRTVFN